MRREPASVRAVAFAPGHITGIFAPRLSAENPLARGSVGAGIVLELGVHARATWTPGRQQRINLRTVPAIDASISRDAVRRVLADRRGTLTLELRHELPIGQGFGMSAAGALAASLATAAVVRRPPRTAIHAAHLADLEGGGGLGGVAAILGGGLEIRSRAGVPPHGRVRHFRFAFPIFISVVGRPLTSPALLKSRSFLGRVEANSVRGLRRLAGRPDPSTLLAEAERFGDRLGLAPPAVRRVLKRLRRDGVRAAQTMFGRSVWAVAPTTRARRALLGALEAGQLSAIELRAAPTGAWSRPAARRQRL